MITLVISSADIEHLEQARNSALKLGLPCSAILRHQGGIFSIQPGGSDEARKQWIKTMPDFSFWLGAFAIQWRA